MVQITLTIRPLPGYNAPKNTETVTVDTSDRVEAITQKLKVKKKGMRFFDRTGRELPLNSSLASNNVQDGDFLEGVSLQESCGAKSFPSSIRIKFLKCAVPLLVLSLSNS